MKQVVRGMGAALGVIIVVRLLDWFFAPLLVPLLVFTVLIGLFVLATSGPGGLKK
jgi:hypothetical protein